MIEAIDLHKYFGDFHAVRGISLHVAPGEVLALLGPNGAGKTTTVRMLSGILQPTSGVARVAGFDVARQPHEVRARIGLLTEYPGLYARMKAMEYLLFFAKLLGMQPRAAAQRAEQLLKQFELWDARDRKLDGYSKGMKQKMALIRAMLHDPPVLFLDEPTTAMDPHSARVVRDVIAGLRSNERSVVLCTHNLVEAETLADQIAVVRGGEIVAQGTEAELTQQLLGDPVWELELGQAVTNEVTLLAELVVIESVTERTLRFRTPDAVQVNPILLDRLHRAGVPVVALLPVSQSLETVYLRIVEANGSEQSMSTRIKGVNHQQARGHAEPQQR